MDLRTVARLHAAGRVVLGAALTVAPRRAGGGWIGDAASGAGTGVFSRALGARDAAMGLGVLWSIEDQHAARPWLVACVVADIVDLAASLAARDELPATGATGVPAVAGASALLGAWLVAALD